MTVCAKKGGLVVLEDFDLPEQSVTERLNSALEPLPSFSLPEDITLQLLDNENQIEIALPKTFGVIATVRFFYLEEFHPNEQLEIFDEFLRSHKEYQSFSYLLEPPTHQHGAWDPDEPHACSP